MFKKIQDIFSIPELKRRILFTMGLLIVYRIGGHITTPMREPAALKAALREPAGRDPRALRSLRGGQLQPHDDLRPRHHAVHQRVDHHPAAAGRHPVLREARQRGGGGAEEDHAVHAVRNGRPLGRPGGSASRSSSRTWRRAPCRTRASFFRLITIITMTAGTIFVMWLGEQITERGIGNGISLIIMIGIVARYPARCPRYVARAADRQRSRLCRLVLLIVIMVVVIAGVILITQGQRRIPVQYAKRIVGRRVYGGQGAVHSAPRQHGGRHSDHLRAVDHDVPEHDRGVLQGKRVHGGRDVAAEPVRGALQFALRRSSSSSSRISTRRSS